MCNKESYKQMKKVLHNNLCKNNIEMKVNVEKEKKKEEKKNETKQNKKDKNKRKIISFSHFYPRRIVFIRDIV